MFNVEYLRQLMAAKDISVGKLASDTGINKSTLSALLNLRSDDMAGHRLLKLAAYFGVDPKLFYA